MDSARRRRKSSAAPGMKAETEAVTPLKCRLRSASSTRHQLQSQSNLQVLGIENCTDGFVACRKKRRTTGKYSPSFPRDIIYSILILLPATVLFETMRYVCKEWNDIISDPLFISAHLHLSSPGILVQDHAKLHLAYYLQRANNTTGFELSEVRLPFPAVVLGSCNGLVLLHDMTSPQVLHVMNLVTGAKTSLPPLAELGSIYIPNTAFAFTASGHYKVVYASGISRNDCCVQVMVYTVGVDKTWREIDLKGISMSKDAKTALRCPPPISSAGFVYWFHPLCGYGFALEADAETTYPLATPKDFVRGIRITYRIKTEKGVCLMRGRDDLNGLKLEVWELMEPKSSTWGRGIDFHADGLYCRLRGLFHPRALRHVRPLVSLENGELWLCCDMDKEYALVCCNQRTGNIWFLPMKQAEVYAIPQSHVNSLLSL